MNNFTICSFHVSCPAGEEDKLDNIRHWREEFRHERGSLFKDRLKSKNFHKIFTALNFDDSDALNYLYLDKIALLKPVVIHCFRKTKIQKTCMGKLLQGNQRRTRRHHLNSNRAFYGKYLVVFITRQPQWLEELVGLRERHYQRRLALYQP